MIVRTDDAWLQLHLGTAACFGETTQVAAPGWFEAAGWVEKFSKQSLPAMGITSTIMPAFDPAQPDAAICA
jgi:hypothetical protein